MEWHFWTDGSASLGKRAGWAYVLVVDGKVTREASGKIGDLPFSAPQAEVTAVLAALSDLRILAEQREEGYPSVKIFSDSEFVVKTLMEWGPKRSAAEWKRKSYADLFVPMLEFIQAYRRHASLEIHHIRGHSGYTYNERADKLARAMIE